MGSGKYTNKQDRTYPGAMLGGSAEYSLGWYSQTLNEYACYSIRFLWTFKASSHTSGISATATGYITPATFNWMKSYISGNWDDCCVQRIAKLITQWSCAPMSVKNKTKQKKYLRYVQVLTIDYYVCYIAITISIWNLYILKLWPLIRKSVKVEYTLCKLLQKPDRY